MSFFFTQKYRQITQTLAGAKNILIVSHLDADGDAVGSALACWHFLRANRKEAHIFISGLIPENFDFLPGYQQIKNQLNSRQIAEADVILILDCGDFQRAGLKDYFKNLDRPPMIINLDHHFSNDNFGQIDLVDSQSSSTAEMVYYFLNFLKREKNIHLIFNSFDKQIATCLLTGIITDTDFFLNPNTTAATFKAVSNLTRAGASLNLILKNIYQRQSIRNLKLWGQALSRLQIDAQTELATTAIFEHDFGGLDFDEDSFKGLSNFLNSLNESKGAMVLMENEQEIKGSLRTTRADVDVAEIAKQYGGGGHKKAAGFRVSGKLVENEKGEWKIEQIF
jgi:phosphoesterase RecJ-like protein